MERSTHFSIDQSLHKLRLRLGKSGAFTYDNIDELESHILDGYEINRKKHSEEEAFQLSMEGLGDPSELTELYYQANQKNIWRNYFWIICLTTFLGFLVYTFTDVFFQLILLLMVKLELPIWFEYMDIGFGFSAGIVFVLGILSFRKKAFQIFHRISASVLKRPISSFALLGIIPFFNVNLLAQLQKNMMDEKLSTFAQSSREIYGIILYLAPLFLLMWSIWRHKQKPFNSFEEKLASRLGICAIIGICMNTLVSLSAMIIADGSMGVLALMKLPLDGQTQLMIPILIFIGFWSLLISFFYQRPEFVLGKSSEFISRHTLSFLFLGLVMISATILMANFSGSLMFEHLGSESMGDFMYYRDLILEKGFTMLLLFLTAFWTFRRARNRKLIAWN